mgnify:CR=1 FL=1
MGVLEQVIRMKGQGIPEGEIINELSQQGVSPREINDALRQAQIKYAISNVSEGEEMQPSITEEEMPPSPNSSQIYMPRNYEQQYEAPQEEYQQQEQQYAPQEQQQYYTPKEGYEQQYTAGIDTDTIMEISDQIFSDRIKKVQNQLDNVTEISTLLQTKMENVSDRLKKVETIIDKLQIAILEKVGSYGKNLESIKKEMSMMQDSFSKMISPSRRTERRQEEPTSSEEASDFAIRTKVPNTPHEYPVTTRVRRQEELEKINEKKTSSKRKTPKKK